MKHPFTTLLRHAAQPYSITLNEERLPAHVIAPCTLSCTWHTEQIKGPLLLSMTIQGILTLQCQRCLQDYTSPYHHTMHLAICTRERDLKESADQYDYVLLAEIDSMADLITDELYFSTPEKHPLDGNKCQV